MTIMDLFQDWTNDLVTFHNVRPSTISYYRDKVRCFVRYSWESRIAIFRDFYRFKQAFSRFSRAPIKDSTKSKVFQTMRQFNDWMTINRITRENVVKILGKTPKIVYPEVEILTIDDIQRVYIAIEKMYKWAIFERNLLIFEVFLYSGIRHNELLNLKVADIGTNYIHIIDGKWGKNRYVGIPEWLGKKIAEYLENNKITQGYIFPSKNGQKSTHRLCSAFFAKIQKRTDIRLYPHKLRHTYATQCLASGMDMHILQRQLGHEDIKMTMKYVHIADTIRFERVQRFVTPKFRKSSASMQKISIHEILRAFEAINVRLGVVDQ